MILAVRTDAPEAYVGIFDDDGGLLREYRWIAHRSLARDLLKVIEEQLKAAGGSWSDIKGLVLFSGPGSFTGLRIGAAVLNTVAHTNQVAIVGVGGDTWAQDGVRRLQRGDDDRLVLPEYGAGAHITVPKK